MPIYMLIICIKIFQKDIEKLLTMFAWRDETGCLQ